MLKPNRPNDDATAIEFADVRFAYRSVAGIKLAVDRIEFVVRSGQFVIVLGPSGCGKSTLLKLAAGLLLPSGGTVRVFGSALAAPSPHVGMAFQNPLLLPDRSVIDNVLRPIEVSGAGKDAFVGRARELLELTGLGGLANNIAGELALEQQQRVSLCRALIHNPRILLLDEPFGTLDAVARTRMNAELQRIWLAWRGTVLMVTHNIEEAIYLADRVLVMSAPPGHIVAQIGIELPRPRTAALLQTPAFAGLSGTIRHHLRVSGSHV